MNLDDPIFDALREAFGDRLMILPPYDEVQVMSLQIRGCADARVRKELRERIGELNIAREAYFHDRAAKDPNASESQGQFFAQLKALYFALTGYHPTEDELQELAAGFLNDASGNKDGGTDDTQTPPEEKPDGQS